MLQVIEPNVKHLSSFERQSLEQSASRISNNEIEYGALLTLQVVKDECGVLLVLKL